MKLDWRLPDPDATERLGGALARALPRAGVLALSGDLGAGKSTLARGLLRALGVTGPIKSPTYTLVESYPLPTGQALHLDLYRIGEPSDLDFLGLRDLEGEAACWLVEWPEKGGARLPPADLEIRLEPEGGGRRAVATAFTDRGRQWLQETSKSAAFRGSV
jgi:tRNA threonylcarbamoyladenosine biosynthesis protein TsaE